MIISLFNIFKNNFINLILKVQYESKNQLFYLFSSVVLTAKGMNDISNQFREQKFNI